MYSIFSRVNLVSNQNNWLCFHPLHYSVVRLDEPQFKRKLEGNVAKHFKNLLLTEQDRKDFEKWSNKLYKAFLNGPDSTADHFYDIVQELLPYGDEERWVFTNLFEV